MPRTRKSTEQPPRAPTGLPQGEHQALVQAQQAVPLPNSQARVDSAIQAAGQGAAPGGPLQTNILNRPTSDRANEPVTTGILGGGTPGPEAIPPIIQPVDQDMAGMAKYLPALEALADQEGSSNALRSWVRRLSGSMPTSIRQADIIRKAAGEQKQ